MILDVARCYLWLFSLYINIKIGKSRLAGDHLYGKLLFKLAVACDVYDGVFLCCPFFPRDVLDEILNLIEAVSEGFPTYSFFTTMCDKKRQIQFKGIRHNKINVKKKYKKMTSTFLSCKILLTSMTDFNLGARSFKVRL